MKLIPADPGESIHVCDYNCERAQSRALVASDGKRAYILQYVGGALSYWLGESGDVQCFDGVAPGLWVWTGNIRSWRSYEGEYDEELQGDFTRLTDEEWDLLQSEDGIWNPEDWDICPEKEK